MRPEFSPLEHPEKYQTQTVRSLKLWLEMAPWIKAGLVKFIRNPEDFDPELRSYFYEMQTQKYEEDPILRGLIQKPESKDSKKL